MNGSTVYAGGSFTNIGGQLRNDIAALDATTGLATAWDPNANSELSAIAVNGSTVYVAGVFSNIGGQPRRNIAALDAQLIGPRLPKSALECHTASSTGIRFAEELAN